MRCSSHETNQGMAMVHSIRSAAIVLLALAMGGCDSQGDELAQVRLLGTVTELPSGDAVNDASVILYRLGIPTSTILASTHTDADGRYVLETSVRRDACGVLLSLFLEHPDQTRPYGLEVRDPRCMEDEQVFNVAFRDPSEAP